MHIASARGTPIATRWLHRRGVRRIDQEPLDMQDTFRNIADRTAAIIGSPWTFVASVVLTAVWLILGPVFRFPTPGS